MRTQTEIGERLRALIVSQRGDISKEDLARTDAGIRTLLWVLGKEWG